MRVLTAYGVRLLLIVGLFGPLVLLAALRLGPTMRGLFYLPIVVAVACAALADVHSRRIPDWLTLPAVAWALAGSLLPGLWRPVDAALGCLAGAGLLLLLAVLSRGAIGGGDIKLMAVIGAAVGPEAALVVLIVSQAAAAMVALPPLLARRRGLQDPLPLGPFLAFPSILAILVQAA